MISDPLNGMFWDIGIDFQIPYFGDTEKVVFVFKKNLAEITWNCMSTLENNPSTLPQTQTILKGQSVSGLSIDDLLQVKNYDLRMLWNGACSAIWISESTVLITHRRITLILSLWLPGDFSF